jgi:hypothetical protein
VTNSAEHAESILPNASPMDGETTGHPIESRPPRLVLARGGPVERGRQIGESTAGLIGAALSVYESRFAHETQMSSHDLTETARAFSAAIEGYSPEIHATLVGIAEGAEVALEKIVLLNSRTEILYSNGPPSELDGCLHHRGSPRRPVLDRPHLYAAELGLAQQSL